MIEIEKGVPIPGSPPNRYQECVDALKKMEIGDSFVHKAKYPEFFREAARRAKVRVAIRLAEPNPNGQKAKGTLCPYRVWRIK